MIDLGLEPVSFSEIDNMTILGEVAYLSRGYAPEVSFGTHFFQDLVENEIFYGALFPEKKGAVFRIEVFDDCANRLSELLPGRGHFENIIKVYDFPQGHSKDLQIWSDVLRQEVMGFIIDSLLQ